MEERTLPKLLMSKEEADKRLQAQIKEGQQLKNWQIHSGEEMEKAGLDASNWSRYNRDLLTALFNKVSEDDYDKFYYQYLRLDVHDMDIIYEQYGISDALEYQKGEYYTKLKDGISGLEGILERLDLYTELKSKSRPKSAFGNDVFIVHGHDETAKLAMADFVKTFDLNPIILDEKANEGQTIIEKFEVHAGEAGYAIILLTPDDVGARKDEKEQSNPRARQNVILELGYFMGKLGRERVCVLHKEEVELPSDIYGILYVSMDSSDGWQLKLAKEMKQAGLPIDLNKLV